MQTDRIAELRALLNASEEARRRPSVLPKGSIDWPALEAYQRANEALYCKVWPNIPALLDCAEALRALLSYTKACEALLNVMPAGQIRIAEEALAKLNGDDHG